MAGLRDLRISNRRVVPARMLSVKTARAGGPGGQHVNKAETKVDVRLDLELALEVFGPFEMNKIRERLSSRIDKDGCLRVVAEDYREQGRNLEVALVRMEALLKGALIDPKKRRPTKPTRGSKERRLKQKKQHSDKKRGRKMSWD